MTLASLARNDDPVSRIGRALERGEEGRGLSREDALLLIEEASLESLLMSASSLRDLVDGTGFAGVVMGASLAKVS